MKVKLVLTEELLGTASNDPKVHENYVASNAPDAASKEEEVAAIGVDGVVEKGMTVFPRENGKPFAWDYMIKGFFKDACGSLKYADGSKSSKLKAFKKYIDGLVFITPRKIMIEMSCNGSIGNCQRPLRANTAQGERIALANSETVPAGSSLTFEIRMLKADMHDVIVEWLNYGELKGLGGWRNSGKGRFTWSEVS